MKIQFIKIIKELGFAPCDGSNVTLKGVRKFSVPKVKFENENFYLTIYQVEKHIGLALEVENKNIKFTYCHVSPNYIVSVGNTVEKGDLIRTRWSKICLWRFRQPVF